MGKHGKSNLSQNEEKIIRQKKKEQFKKKVFNHTKEINDKQNKELPRLKNHKLNILKDLENKNQGNSRNDLIKTLNRKLEKEVEGINNNVPISNLLQGSKQTKGISSDINANNLILSENYLGKDEEVFFTEDIKGNKLNQDFSKKAFMKDLKQVVEASDVVLEVLDARDPLAFRSKELEELVKSYPDKKRLILIVNKIDLVTPENSQAWKEYFKREYPCVLFKANTQNQSSNLSNVTLYHSSISKQRDFVDEIINSNKAVGGEDLMNILKNYCRIGDTKKSLVVGIVGFPNVGKSSIINSLKRSKAVGVSSTPGYTKSINEVILDKNIKLLDSPGVVYSNSEVNILTNIIRSESISNPVEVVRKILNKVQRDEVIRVYNLDKEFDSNDGFKVLLEGVFDSNKTDIDLSQVEKFLCFLGMQLGKFQKGGIVDINQTAVAVIQDWNSGKLKYMSKVPNQYLNEDQDIEISNNN